MGRLRRHPPPACDRTCWLPLHSAFKFWGGDCLQDHPKVKEYEHVKGMVHDVFFVTHTEPEVGDKEVG